MQQVKARGIPSGLFRLKADEWCTTPPGWLLRWRHTAMLRAEGLVVFVGCKCCVCFSKALKYLDISFALRSYAAFKVITPQCFGINQVRGYREYYENI